LGSKVSQDRIFLSTILSLIGSISNFVKLAEADRPTSKVLGLRSSEMLEVTFECIKI
jgi:hypothetical protein